jgi:hypothetical protein
MEPGTLFHDLRRLLTTEKPAELGPTRREGTLAIAQIDAGLESAFQTVDATPAVRDLIRSVIYLWHDHLDEAHIIAQEIENVDGSLVHGMMHRREPDYGNAKYWFRRVGSHPAFLILAVRAGELLEKAGESDLHSRLLPNRTWDPFAFVDAVEDAAEGKFKSKTDLLQEIQRIEFEALIENLAHRVSQMGTQTNGK